jgi:hypothetical protein
MVRKMSSELIWNSIELDGSRLIWCENAPDHQHAAMLSAEQRSWLLHQAVLGENVLIAARQLGLPSFSVTYTQSKRGARRRWRRGEQYLATIVL